MSTHLPNPPYPTPSEVGTGLENTQMRVRYLEMSPNANACGPWYYTGSLAQAAGMQDPYGTLLTTLIGTNPGGLIIAWQNSWVYSGAPDAPPSFMLDGCMVVLRGALVGGNDNTAMFTLPLGFRPYYQQELVVPTGSAFDWTSVTVMPSGDVVFNAEN